MELIEVGGGGGGSGSPSEREIENARSPTCVSLPPHNPLSSMQRLNEHGYLRIVYVDKRKCWKLSSAPV